MACPTENSLVALIEGHLAASEAKDVEEHFFVCSHCRALLSQLKQSISNGSLANGGLAHVGWADRASREDEQRAIGTVIGRFVIVGIVGHGSMGRVYAAYDPTVDRQVALKMLRATRNEKNEENDASLRLVREAQSAGRVIHPNVVSIYDVVTIETEQSTEVCLAMEFVNGETLREWMRKAKRSWTDILAIFLQAGRGLAAAHNAGLVHRDFKPENVLVGLDGRVRVTDFGLARSFATQEETTGTSYEEQARSGARPGRLTTMTRTGAIVGTPAYLAPEQYDGAKADPASDQFAYCVALYEALYGERPFKGETIDDLARAIREGSIAEAPAKTRVPGWLRRIILRGLSAKPSARFDSMNALLKALENNPEKRRRRMALFGLVALTGVLAVGFYTHRQHQLARSCRAEEEAVLRSWDGNRKTQLEARFLATGEPYASNVWQAASRTLDEYAAKLGRTSRESCEATKVQKTQSDEVFRARAQCLGTRKSEYEAAIALFSKADTTIIERAFEVTSGLSAIAECDDLHAIALAGFPFATETRREDLESKLAETKALERANKTSEAVEKAEKLIKVASEVGDTNIKLRAQYELALLLAAEKPGSLRAWQLLTDTAYEAEAKKFDALAANVWSFLAYSDAYCGKPELIEPAARQAATILERLGNPPLLVATFRFYYSRALEYVGRYAEQETLLRDAFSTFEALYGREHSKTLAAATMLSKSLTSRGKFAEAQGYLDAFAPIIERNFGASHPRFLWTLVMTADLHSYSGDFAKAIPEQEYLLDAGLSDLVTIYAYGELSHLLIEEGRLEDALDAANTGIRIAEQEHYGKVEWANGLMSRADVLVHQGKSQQAIKDANAADAIFFATAADYPNLPLTLTILANAHFGLRQHAMAKSFAERAIQTWAQNPMLRTDLANAQFVLAKARWELDKGDAEAIRIAKAARDEYKKVGKGFLRHADQVDAWLGSMQRRKTAEREGIHDTNRAREQNAHRRP